MKPPTICSPRFWPTAFSTWPTSSGSSSNGPPPDHHGFPMNEFELIARLTESLETNANTVGGETTANPERILLSVSVLGTTAKGKCPLRSGAKAGDAIFVTGELGGTLSGKHLDFEPRLEEARWLVDHFPIHAMMDISDGLA